MISNMIDDSRLVLSAVLSGMTLPWKTNIAFIVQFSRYCVHLKTFLTNMHNRSRLTLLNIQVLRPKVDIVKGYEIMYWFEIFTLTGTWLDKSPVYTSSDILPKRYIFSGVGHKN